MKNIYLRKKIEEIGIALVKSCIILCILLPLSATVVKNHINDSSPETYDTYECCNIENIENHINIQKNILQNIQKNNFEERHNIESTYISYVSTNDNDNVNDNFSVNDNLVDSVSRIIMCEAGGVKDDYWQQLVGYVFLNRLDSSYYPDSVDGVLKEGYAPETIQNFNNIVITNKALKNAKIVVNNYYSGSLPVPRNLIYQAEFSQGRPWKHIGNTYFGINPNLPQ